MNYSDTQLKQALAKMLPTELQWGEPLAWKQVNQNYGRLVLDTELLHLCWLVEKDISPVAWRVYSDMLTNSTQDAEVAFYSDKVGARYKSAHATWQQRTIALAKVKGVEII